MATVIDGDTGVSQVQDGAIVQADLASGVAGTGPAFSAYPSSNLTITSNVWTKVQADTEVFDTNSNYDPTTNYRFTPTVAGYYQINAGVRVTSTGSITNTVAAIYKNGVLYADNVVPPFASTFSVAAVSSLISLNGSTDYIELYVLSQAAGTITLETNTTQTYINGAMVRAA
jgi:hypothetical protein